MTQPSNSRLCQSALLVRAGVVSALLAAPAPAGVGDQIDKLLPDDGADNDRFGIAVAIDGTTAIVAALFDDDTALNSGSAYLFDTTTGQQTHKLVAADADANDRFGISVAISGSAAIVGANWDDDAGSRSGSAYLFSTTTGAQTFKLTANDAAAGDEFGRAVAISGTIAVVGAMENDDDGTASGSVYLFNAGSGLQINKLSAIDAEAGDEFGSAVAIDDTTVLVGAHFDDGNGTDSGSAYIFNASTGQQTGKLIPADGAQDDRFGCAVAVRGTTAIVGAYLDDDDGNESGSAYLYDISDPNDPILIAKLTPDDGEAGARFGYDVALDNGVAIVGAVWDDDNGTQSGSAYLFDAATGDQIAKILPEDGTAFDGFGESVGISGGVVVVGSPLDDDNGSGSGSAYLFATAPVPCNAADLAEPYDQLDLPDINAFVAGFTSQHAIADLDGNGIWDLVDINLFVDAFVAGCP